MNKRMLGHHIISILTAGAVCAALPLSAFAEQSPDFAYTAEEWATIRDNELDFNEIDKLVHEYNPTVLQNALDYKDFVGKTSSDIANNYYEAAEKIIQNMAYPDEESANYASGVAAYLSSEINYENLMEQGDNNTNDAETYYLMDAHEEANIVKQAKQQMISYWSQYYNLEVYRGNIATAEKNLNSVSLRAAAGTATEMDRLNAEQALTNARTTLQNAEANLKTTRESLLLMLGWNYGSDAVIHELPGITAETIGAIDLNTDIEAAKNANYSLRLINRQLENARTPYVREQLTADRDTANKKIEENVTELYRSIQKSLTELTAARETLTVKAKNLETAQRKHSAGMMTEKDLSSAEAAYSSAGTQVKLKEIALLQAYTNYEAAVGGLAATS